MQTTWGRHLSDDGQVLMRVLIRWGWVETRVIAGRGCRALHESGAVAGDVAYADGQPLTKVDEEVRAGKIESYFQWRWREEK